MSKQQVAGGGGKLGLDALRMPLDTQDGQAFMDKGLQNVVLRTPLDGNQSFSKLFYTLMMSTVYHRFFPV